MKQITYDKLLSLIPDSANTAKVRDAWYSVGGVQVYLRLRHNSITIANVSVIVKKRGKGIFTSFLFWCEANSAKVIVENVLNNRLAIFLEKRGYVRINNSPASWSNTL